MLRSLLLIGLALSPFAAHAFCVDLRGRYNECQLTGAVAEKFSFELSQRVTAGEMVYTGKTVREGKALVIPFVADARSRALGNDRGEPVAPVPLEYLATCDPVTFVITVTATSLANTASERFQVTRAEDGGLKILNQSILFGTVVSSREVVCQKLQETNQ